MRLTRRFALFGGQKIVKKVLFFQLFSILSNLSKFWGFGLGVCGVPWETAEEKDGHR
jgi:hypothetical protein